MNIRLFKKYLEMCNELNVLPNWKGLNSFKRAFR